MVRNDRLTLRAKTGRARCDEHRDAGSTSGVTALAVARQSITAATRTVQTRIGRSSSTGNGEGDSGAGSDAGLIYVWGGGWLDGAKRFGQKPDRAHSDRFALRYRQSGWPTMIPIAATRSLRNRRRLKSAIVKVFGRFSMQKPSQFRSFERTTMHRQSSCAILPGDTPHSPPADGVCPA